jgi:hypothetical protein
MKTKKQEELVNSFLSQFNDDIKTLYYEIAKFLSDLGYNPAKDKTRVSFKHDLHNKQIAKMGASFNKKKGVAPFFSLRFSACGAYSKRIAGIVDAYMSKYPTREARCTIGGCNYCAGEPYSHVYTREIPAGIGEAHCGAYAIEIPDLSIGDLPEIKALIKEEHEYLMKREAKTPAN